MCKRSSVIKRAKHTSQLQRHLRRMQHGYIMQTQESIFRFVGSAGLGGGFAAGSSLPREKGNLKDFKLIRISAVEGEDYSKFERRLIEKLGEKPKQQREIRAR